MAELEKGIESILFVDDETYLADVGKEMLEDYGYSVVSMTSAKEACGVFAQAPDQFDLVITDYTMPGMTGTQLAKQIKEINAAVPIVMCTGMALEPEHLQGVELEKVLIKPLEMNDLLLAVRDVLDK